MLEMNYWRFNKCFLVCCIVLSIFVVGASDCYGARLRVAVVEFDVKGELDIQDAGEIIPEMLVTTLGANSAFDLKERVLLKRVLKEQSLSLTGVIDSASASEIGRIFGVEGIITGSIVKWGRITQVNARLIDTRDGTVLQTASIEATQIDDIPGKVHQLAAQFTKTGAKGGALPSALSNENRLPAKGSEDAPKLFQEKLSQSKALSSPATTFTELPRTYSGTWFFRSSHSELRELNYSKLMMKQSGNKISGIHYLPNGGKVKIEGEVSAGSLAITFLYQDDKSLETGLLMHGIENVKSLDIANMRRGMSRNHAKALANLSGDGLVLEGTMQMWYIDFSPYTYTWLATVGSANVYDAGTPVALEKSLARPIKLVFSEK